MKSILLSLAVVAVIGVSSFSLIKSNSDKTANRIESMNENWQYLSSNASQLEEIPTITNWESVDLPHSWNSLDATDMTPGYKRGAGWYKKILDFEVNDDKRYFIYFEGANITTDVYVNNEKAGTHIGGYVGFEIELTDFLDEDRNEIAIRVNNDQNREVIPSSKSDFFIFGGITRDVWLKTIPKSAAVKNIQVKTPSVSESSASTVININAIGNSLDKRKIAVKVKSPSGKVIFQETKDASEKVTFSYNLESPELWDVDNPNLYTIEASILKGNKAIDLANERFGYRWFEFKENGPFYLNGKPLKLRGTHRHEEHAGYGAAVPNEVHRSDIKMIKEMGANMIRLAHYPQDPEVYKACDELGIIVWDELPWCRGGLGNDVWKSNTKRLLSEMINQNYNHPSIVFWSLGNEIYWLPDFPNGDNREQINVFLNELNTIAKSLDPGRLTSIRKYYEGAHIPDVFSPSIWSGWYSGKYTDYQASVDNAIGKYKRFIHAEYGGSSHVGRHNEKITSLDNQIASTYGNEAIVQVNQINYAQDGDWSENYIVDLFDWHLKVSETTENFAGNIQWAFKDFGTPLRPENDIPYMNQKGLVDREGNPKDAYYVFKSYWSKDPFTYIESKTWTERYGNEGEAKEISVYSNCPTVELFHNGKSLGERKKDIEKFPATGLTWDVAFTEGSNQLISVGDWDGKTVYDTLNLTYYYAAPGPPRKIKLSYELIDKEKVLLTATAVDAKGRRATTYQNKIYFQSLKGGALKESHGTPTGSSVIAMANGKASIEFYPDYTKSESEVMVLNQDFKGTYLRIPLKK